ncbi:hypothetical protein [Amycolatopsis sp. lyj-112]|uniref:hypothetical protein n=1 Tax=Amycolatopsis sp. lyj-112 TaxID=2789288 RepID=UPI00397E1B13
MPQPTTVATAIVVQRGVCFAVGGHSCTTWHSAVDAYECDHGFVMWQSQIREAFRAGSDHHGDPR